MHTRIKITLIILLVFAAFLSANDSEKTSSDKKDKPKKKSALNQQIVYYGQENRKRSLLQQIDCYVQPQVGLGYNMTANEKSIIMLGAYAAFELWNFRLGFSGNLGSSFSYYGVQVEKLIPIYKENYITLRFGNFGKKSTNAGIFYEARIENISALLGVEFATHDITEFDTYNYAFSIGMGIILDDMNY
ncbi:MAG: hypothetical protein WCT23_08235 [Candidatus Neomarinimicrobiota bacterium]